VIDQSGLGGQAATTQILDNFPAFEQGITGQEFAHRLELQARRFNTGIVQGEQIVDIVRDGQYLIVKSINKREYVSRAVLIATGSQYKRLNVPGEDELIGYNVHFCATCDGPFYKGKDVLVIGGGNSGFEEGLHLATMARSVTIVEFNPEAKASQILQEKVAEQESMRVVTNHAVLEFKVKNDNQLAGVVVEDRATGEVKAWHQDGVFVFIGLSPNSSFLPATIERDPWGFIKTDATLRTSLEGVYAAGDVREGSTKQAISAAGEGATAALMIRQYLKSLGDVNPVNSIERETIEVSRV
jgi:thioredoxin reductase (NADPH)